MPPLPDEERMLTVFADIHSYFSKPTPKRTKHRFDKGSYVYIYHDSNQHKSRIEVANNAGTPDQDAFNGVLDRIHLCHSTRFPSLCTLTVDEFDPNPQAFPPPPDPASLYEWRLPSSDPRDEETDLLRLHTLDIYFWTSEDASEFLDVMEQVLSHGQVETDRHDPPEELENETGKSDNNVDHEVSKVVTQLENVAVTDPAYQNGQTRNSRSDIVSNTLPTTQGGAVAGMNSFPPPPAAPTTAAPVPTNEQTPASPPPTQEQQYAPLPYNPVAPAAPEPIKHREKTPPPPDGTDGTGLAAAVAVDSGLPYAPPPTQPTVGGSFPPPPPPATNQVDGQAQGQGHYPVPGSYASPPPSAGLPPNSAPGLTHSGSLSSRSSSTIQNPPGFIPPYAGAPVAPSPSSPFFPGGVGTGHVAQQHLNRAGSVSFAPPPQAQIQPQQQPQIQFQPQVHQDPNAAANLYLYQQQQLLQQQQHQQQQQQQAYIYGQLQGQPHPLQQQIASPQGTPTTATFTPSVQPYPYSHDQQPRSLGNTDPQVQLQLQKLAEQQQQQQQQQQQLLAAGAGAGAKDQPPSAQRHGGLERGFAKMDKMGGYFAKKLNKF